MRDDLVDLLTDIIFDGGDSTKSISQEIAVAVIAAMRSRAPTCQQCGAILPFDYRSVTNAKESPLK